MTNLREISTRIIDLTNMKFGMLTVKEFAGMDKHRMAMWDCKCECGKETIVRGSSLQRGTTRSCGCLKKIKQFKLPVGEASFNHVYRKYISNAKKRGIKFDMSKEDFKRLSSQPCEYCGKEPSQTDTVPNINGDYVYSGLDRIDNTDYYHVDNMIPCCIKCNKRKYTMTLSEFLERDYMVQIRNGGFNHDMLFKIASLLQSLQ